MEITSRNDTVDIFRLIASFFIVFLHVGMEDIHENIAAFIRISGRWGVPFFFLLSGFFFYKSLLRNSFDAVKKSCFKIISILIVADIVYIVAQYIVNGTFDWQHLFPGAYFHLWFLPSLILGTLTTFVFYKLQISSVIIFGISLFIILIVLFTDSYGFVIGMEHRNLIGLVIPLLSIPFMAIGFFFFNDKSFASIVNKRNGFFLMGFGFLLQLIEIKAINIYTGRPMTEHQYLIGTFFLATGLFVLSLTINLKSRLLGHWGRDYSLFIYLYHPLIVMICYQTSYKTFFFGNLIVLLPIVIFLITLLIGLFIHKYLNSIFLILTGSIKEAFS